MNEHAFLHRGTLLNCLFSPPPPPPNTTSIDVTFVKSSSAFEKKTNNFFCLNQISERGKHSSPCKYSVNSPQHTHTRFFGIDARCCHGNQPNENSLFNGAISGDTYTKLSDKCTLYFFGSWHSGQFCRSKL